jgi:hypothetical protein
MAIKTNIKDITNIGDKIISRYTSLTSGQVGVFSELGTSTATMIPTTSSATPDGAFYWIYVGRDYLGRKKFFADRVIQHSISLDAINSSGICSESKFFTDLIRTSILTVDNEKSGFPVTNITDNSSSTYWLSTQASTSGKAWLSIDLGTPDKFHQIKMSTGYGCTSFDLKYSDDGINYNLVQSYTNLSMNTILNLSVIDVGIHRYWKLDNIMSTYGGANLGSICYLNLLKDISDTYNKYAIRLLSGGISTGDTDNEWDKIIVNSTLSGTITAGDNNVWNWSGINSWTSSTGTTSANRIIRGNTSVSATNAPTGVVTTTSGTTIGFRPVLLIDQLMIYKYLVKQNENYYTINSSYYDSTTNHNFISLTLNGGTVPNSTDINTFGFSDLSLLTTNMTSGGDTFLPIDKLNNQFDIKMYKE